VDHVQYADSRFLRIGGAGETTTTTGGGWIGGGFGVAGALEGALLAGVLNAMTTRSTSSIETLLHMNAGSRESLLLNQEVQPRVLEVQLAPVYSRLQAAQPPSPPGSPIDPDDRRLDQLRQLGDLRSAGVLTDEEFQGEKDRILRGL